MDRPKPIPEAEATLLTITIVFRVVGLLWLITLSVLSLTTQPAPAIDGRLVMWSVVAAVIWTVLTMVLWRMFPRGFSSLFWLLPDLAVAAVIALIPQLSGANSFFVGGFPISSAILWATTRGVPGGFFAGLVIAIASVQGYGSDLAARTAEVFAINSLAPVVIGWGFGSIRRNDDSRRRAESALAAERAERIRAAERAEVAAHLHDSVLQTLALIQRRSDDQSEVRRLARSQERELRTWLNSGVDTTGGGLMDLIHRSAAEVERDFGVAIDLSTVGDAGLDRGVEAIAAAAREAMTNAVKFSGVDRVFVLAEARPHELRIVVRDRGAGFDRISVGDDRRGLGESIEGRMTRHGGSATVRSAPGEGTEVDLRLPREVR